MNVHGGITRTGLAGALLILVSCAVGGCAAASGGSAAGSAPASALSPSPSPTDSGSGSVGTVTLPSAPASAPTSPAASSAPPVQPSSHPSPSGSVCPIKEQKFVQIESVGVDSSNGLNRITAAPAEVICGPGVPDDQIFQTTGGAAVYDVSTAVKINEFDPDSAQPKSITWAQFAASDLGEYSGYYGIDLGQDGLIITIDQYFHP
jgi:hypothetical protein